jgi:hypothetical protein
VDAARRLTRDAVPTPLFVGGAASCVRCGHQSSRYNLLPGGSRTNADEVAQLVSRETPVGGPRCAPPDANPGFFRDEDGMIDAQRNL